MTEDTFERGFTDRLAIDPEVCRMLGVTRQQLAAMDLGAFAMLVFAKGYEVSVTGFDAKEGHPGGLMITTDKFASVSQS